MSKRVLGIGLIVMVVINVILIAILVFHSDRHDGMGRGPSQMLKRHLNLSEQQETKFDELRDTHFNAVEPKMQEIGDLKIQLMNTRQYEEARNLTKQIGQLEGEIDLLTYEHFTAVRDICTPEQKKRMSEMAQRMSKRIRERHGPPRGARH